MEKPQADIRTKMEVMHHDTIDVVVQKQTTKEIKPEYLNTEEHCLQVNPTPFSPPNRPHRSELRLKSVPITIAGSLSQDPTEAKSPGTHLSNINSYNQSLHQIKEFTKVSVISMIENSARYQNKPKGETPHLPRKQLILSISLLLLGFIMFLVGIISAITSKDPNASLAYWVIGGLCGLPGAYYAVRFCRARYAISFEARNKAIEEIPHE